MLTHKICGDAYVHATAPRSACDSLHVQHVTRSGSPHNVMHSSSINVVHGQIFCVQTLDKTTLVQHMQNLVQITMFNVDFLVVA